MGYQYILVTLANNSWYIDLCVGIGVCVGVVCVYRYNQVEALSHTFVLVENLENKPWDHVENRVCSFSHVSVSNKFFLPHYLLWLPLFWDPPSTLWRKEVRGRVHWQNFSKNWRKKEAHYINIVMWTWHRAI
jgi:hypothetical protein